VFEQCALVEDDPFGCIAISVATDVTVRMVGQIRRLRLFVERDAPPGGETVVYLLVCQNTVKGEQQHQKVRVVALSVCEIGSRCELGLDDYHVPALLRVSVSEKSQRVPETSSAKCHWHVTSLSDSFLKLNCTS